MIQSDELTVILAVIRTIPVSVLLHNLSVNPNKIKSKAEYSPYTGLTQFKDGSRAKIVSLNDKKVWRFHQV